MTKKQTLQFVALPLTAAVLLAGALTTRAQSVDWEHLPLTSLANQLTANGWRSAEAATMVSAVEAEASRDRMPVDVLFGAVFQESQFNNYGVNYDFGNYSCGISQSNLAGWCEVVNGSSSLRSQYGYPDKLDCEDIQQNNQAIMGPMLDAVKANRKLTIQGAFGADFQKLDAQTMIAQMPGDDVEAKTRYYKAALSFANYCSNSNEGLRLASTQLKNIYDSSVPDEVKRLHPHTAWVMADAIYNLGPVLASILEQNGGSDVWQNLTPQTMIDVISSVMRARPAGATSIAVQTPDGTVNVDYFRLCVNQRHIEHVMRATLPKADQSIINASTQICN